MQKNGVLSTLMQASKQELQVLSVLLDQDIDMGNEERGVLGIMIDYQVALKIAGEVDEMVNENKSQSLPSCRIEEIKALPVHNEQQQIIPSC